MNRPAFTAYIQAGPAWWRYSDAPTLRELHRTIEAVMDTVIVVDNADLTTRIREKRAARWRPYVDARSLCLVE